MFLHMRIPKVSSEGNGVVELWQSFLVIHLTNRWEEGV